MYTAAKPKHASRRGGSLPACQSGQAKGALHAAPARMQLNDAQPLDAPRSSSSNDRATKKTKKPGRSQEEEGRVGHHRTLGLRGPRVPGRPSPTREPPGRCSTQNQPAGVAAGRADRVSPWRRPETQPSHCGCAGGTACGLASLPPCTRDAAFCKEASEPRITRRICAKPMGLQAQQRPCVCRALR